MKLFMFYPNDYCRMYVLGECANSVAARHKKLFEKYFVTNYGVAIDLYDKDEQNFIEQKRERFLKGLSKVEEVPDGIVIDANY